MSEIICYGVQRNLSEKYAKKKPLKEMSRTLLAQKSFCGGGVLIVPDNTFTDEELNKIGEDYAMNPSKYENNMQEQGYAIRKLTPRECFRLMGVKDEDFDKIEKNQSNSSLYHLAGDSLLTTVIGTIFCNMIETPISFEEMVNSLYKSPTK